MITDCWNQIGVKGNRSCGELKAVIHCHNCPVYSAAGRQLLDQESPEGYQQEWTQFLAAKVHSKKLDISPTDAPISGPLTPADQTLSVVIFRLGGEWLALKANLLQEITHPSPIHTLPHRSNSLLLGLVNIRGEILLCISLENLLNITSINDSSLSVSPVVYQRMLLIKNQEQSWVFSADEIYGVYRLEVASLQGPPTVVSKAADTYTQGMIPWRDRQVSYLDDALLFHTLNRRLL